MLSPLGEKNVADGSTTVAKPLGIGRGMRASQTLPPAPVPTEATISTPLKINAGVLHENREFLRDIARKLQNDNKPAYQADISAEFENRTGFPLIKIAKALGFRTEDELFDHMDPDLIPRSESFAQARINNPISTSVNRVRGTHAVKQPAKPSHTRSRKSGKPSRFSDSAQR